MSWLKRKLLPENAAKDASSRYKTASYSEVRKPNESMEEKMTRMNLQRSQESSESIPTRQEHVAMRDYRAYYGAGALETVRR